MERPGEEVDAKSDDLMKEFFEHMQAFLALHPEYEERRDEIFQAWVIQKLAGIQLSIMEIANRLNAFTQRYEQEKGNP